MKKLIITVFLLTSSNTYAYGIDVDVIDLNEPYGSAVERFGLINSQKQKNIERYQIEARQIKKEDLDKTKNQPYENGLDKQMYQDKINKFSNELMIKRNQSQQAQRS